MVSLKRRIIDWMFENGLRKSRERQSVYRQIQEETARKEERVLKVIVFEDIGLPKDVKQEVYSYVVKVRDGALVQMPPNTPYDTVISTDFNTLLGLIDEKCTIMRRDGTVDTIAPFTAYDAHRLGRLKWRGIGGLSNLLLFEEKVLPIIKQDMQPRLR
jgi:hypothetical protein